MEDVLKLYSAPLKKSEPLVCLDERPVQLLDDVRPRKKVSRGYPARIDYEYRRMGTANVFAIVAPKLGRHLTYASENRKAPAYVEALQRIATAFPKVRRIHLVQDNLSTSVDAALASESGPEALTQELLKSYRRHFLNMDGITHWLFTEAARHIPAEKKEIFTSVINARFRELAEKEPTDEELLRRANEAVAWWFNPTQPALHQVIDRYNWPVPEDVMNDVFGGQTWKSSTP